MLLSNRNRLLIRSVFLATAVWALPGTVDAQKKTKLTEHYVLGRIRVFYANKGISAVEQTDADKSGVPDHVEDVAKQVWAAHQLFCKVLKFPDPFESERYPKLTCIEIGLRDREEKGGGNGTAYEKSQRARPIPEGKSNDRTLVMVVATQVDPVKGVTPSHEFFHLIQYSATYFKNPWYLEGQARWAEHSLAKDGLGGVKYSPRGPWPQSQRNLKQLFGMKYAAEYVLWNPIAARTDRAGILSSRRLGKELTTLRYSDGSRVLKDNLLKGPTIMRDILIELGKMDDIAFKELGYESWSEANQKSPANCPYIYQAIMDVLRKHARPIGRFKAAPRK